MIAFLKSQFTSRAVVALLAMTLIASVVMGRESPAPSVVALASPAAPLQTAEPLPQFDLQRHARLGHAEQVPDLFAPRSSVPPPSAAIVNAEPPQPAQPPSAPPLPFTYLGQFIDGERTEIFVALGDEHYSVERGKTLEGKYKVENITATAVTFVYLPLGTRQKLAIPVLK
jgi:hypothetical protein